MMDAERTEARRPWGSGSVELVNGLYHGRLPRKLGRARLHPGRETRQEAAADLAVELERIAGCPDGLSVAEWGETWLAQREVSGHYRNTRKDRLLWGRRVAGTVLGALPLSEVGELDVRRWLEGLRSDSGGRLSGQTLSNALSIVRRAIEAARIEGLCEGNAARDVRLPKGARARTSEGWTWLRRAEIEAVLAAPLRDPRLKKKLDTGLECRSALTVAIFAGLRAGELWGLRWEDVDEDLGVLHVRHSYTGPPKNGKTRDVPLLEPAREALRAWRIEYKERGIRSPRGLVWPARDGGDCHAEGFTARLSWALRHAGITRRVRFHDLRHTCASWLLQGLFPEYTKRPLRLEEVQAWLGHSEIGVTQRYAHLCTDGLRAIVSTRAPADGPGPEGGGQGGPGRSRHTEGKASQSENNGPKMAQGDSGNLSAPGTIRTCDLRFRKPLANTQVPSNECDLGGGVGHSLGRLGLSELRDRFYAAVAERDPFALHVGLDLADAVGKLLEEHACVDGDAGVG